MSLEGGMQTLLLCQRLPSAKEDHQGLEVKKNTSKMCAWACTDLFAGCILMIFQKQGCGEGSGWNRDPESVWNTGAKL